MIAIIKYNAGNITSVKNCVQRLGFECIVTDNPDEIIKADKVIFPGVGEASSAMNHLKANNLDQVIKSLKQATLGICLGQQLLCSFSEEGNTECLDIFDVQVRKFPPLDLVPHMGWNSITSFQGELFKAIEEESNVYFVHSYYCELSEYTSSICNYILPFSASMQKNNFYTTQFHPEKSGDLGEKILLNFLKL